VEEVERVGKGGNEEERVRQRVGDRERAQSRVEGKGWKKKTGERDEG
jgi:hypothetical protein